MLHLHAAAVLSASASVLNYFCCGESVSSAANSYFNCRTIFEDRGLSLYYAVAMIECLENYHDLQGVLLK